MKTSTSTRSGRHGATLHAVTWRPDGDVRAHVVLVHGFAEHSGRYEHVAEALTSAGFAVHSMDLRGHGQSAGVPFGTVDSFDALVGDVEDLVDDVRTEGPTFVYGHSMGGLAALMVAERRGSDLAGAVIASAVLKTADSIPAPVVAIANLLGRVAPNLPTIALDGTAVSRDPEVVADYNADPLNYRGKISAGTGREMSTAMKVAMTNAGAIACPLLIIHGTNDRLTEPSGSVELAARAGTDDITIQLWPGAAHELHNEPEKAEVLAVITEWMTERVP